MLVARKIATDDRYLLSAKSLMEKGQSKDDLDLSVPTAAPG